MEIGNRIRQYRTARGWNQEDLAEKAFVSRQTISNWEKLPRSAKSAAPWQPVWRLPRSISQRRY